MELDDIGFIFNRAIEKSFSRKRIALMFVTLAFCGLLLSFFYSLALTTGTWMRMSLTFLPLFLSAGLLLSAGVLIVRLYHDEIKHKPTSFRETIAKSWELVIGASYFSLPIALCYLLLWMVMGVFVLFEQLPVIGDLFGSLLAFAPFLIYLGSLVLLFVSFAMLFFVTPILALKGLNGAALSKTLGERLKNDLFSNLLLGLVSLLPLLLVVAILSVAGLMAGPACFADSCDHALYQTLRYLTMMIPFVAVLAPVFVFFFQFAAEAHVLMVKESKKG